MKDTHFLYSVATLAIGSLLSIFVSLATGTLPTSTPREARGASAARETTPAKNTVKKDCDCCRERTPEELAASQERLASLRKQRLAYQKASELLKQYGFEEGLRRTKAFAPEVAEQLEHFIEKYTIAEEH